MLAVVTAIEWATPIGTFSLRSRLPGFLYWFVGIMLASFTLIAFQSIWALLGIQPLLVVPVNKLGTIASIAAGIVLADFISYWNHRFQHRFLWSFHAMHHSQTDLHAANGYGHFTDKGFRYLLFAAPLSLVHFEVAGAPFALVLIRELLERYIHSPTTLHMGPLRWIFVDNRYHRIHHSIEPQHFDRNFGILLSVWDRLFGTAYNPAADEWPATGTTGCPPPQSLAGALLFPLLYIGLMRRRPLVTGTAPKQSRENQIGGSTTSLQPSSRRLCTSAASRAGSFRQ
jgi:sterol desaturase/sphingolipid hydroxylase (fatty acid hydroxylase superfamily)